MALSSDLARLVSTTTKTPPQWRGITPRWLLSLLPYIQLNAATYRVNRVESDPNVMAGHDEGVIIPDAMVGLEEIPQEYTLSPIDAALRIHTRVMDLYNDPYEQVYLQATTVIQVMKELQEDQVINSPTFGLLNSVADGMKIDSETGPPTPNDFDNLISLVWNRPAFFVANPKTIARFGQECTKRGVCIGAVEMLGSPFQTWRGIPIVPSNKVHIDDKGNTNILLLRVGAENQGVVGLMPKTVKNEIMPGISMRLNGIDDTNLANYMISLYHSVAVHTEEALGVMNIKL